MGLRIGAVCNRKKISFLFILFLFFILTVIFHITFLYAQDWTVTSVEVVKDSTILLNNNLIIKENGHLNLINVNLTMNCLSDGEFRIEVEPGGCLFVDSCEIQAAYPENGYVFLAAGDSLNISNSVIQHAGHGVGKRVMDRDDLNGELGLTVTTPLAVIDGNEFINNEVGIILADSAIVVRDNNFIDNYSDGVRVHFGVECKIENNNCGGINYGGSITIWYSKGIKVINNIVVCDSPQPRGIVVIDQSSNNLIERNNVSGSGVGVTLMFVSNNNTIRDNTFFVGEYGVLAWGWNNIIEGNDISPWRTKIDIGIYLGFVYNTLVQNNKISILGNSEGIWLDHSSANLITNNEIRMTEFPQDGNMGGLIVNRNSKLNVISDNRCQGCRLGMGLFYSSDSNFVYNNNFVNSKFQNLVIDGSSGNIIFSNNILEGSGEPLYDNGENVWNFNGPAPEWIKASLPESSGYYNFDLNGENTIENVTSPINGIYLTTGSSLTIRNCELSIGYNPNGTSIKIEPGATMVIEDSKIQHIDNGYGFGFTVCSGATLEMRNSEIVNSGYEYNGLDIFADDFILDNNIFRGTLIKLYECSGGQMTRNYISNHWHLLSLINVNNLTMEDNKFLGSIDCALTGNGDNILIRNNTFSQIWAYGLGIDGSNIIMDGNTFQNIHAQQAALNASGNQITIKKNNITDCYLGIRTNSNLQILENFISSCFIGLQTRADGNELRYNNILQCEYGIDLVSDNNTVVLNTVVDCDTGLITGPGTQENMIYQNNFIDNEVQAFEEWHNSWDSTGIGNFWSDYTGDDTNGDGIGDIPYHIQGETWDHFPLMSTSSINIKPIYLDVFSESIIPLRFSAGDTNVIIAKISIQITQENSGKTANFLGLSIDRNGTGLDSDLSNIKIWKDVNNDESFNADLDSLIGQGVLNEGKANLTFYNEESITLVPNHFFISIDISSTISSIGNTVGFSCQDSSYFLTKFPAKVKNTNFPMVFNEQTLPVEQKNLVPLTFSIEQNYPNPFNSGTLIYYQIPKPSNVLIQIFNPNGQLVRTLVNKQMGAAFHAVYWDGKDDTGFSVASGIYFYKVTTVDFIKVKKMILIQ